MLFLDSQVDLHLLTQHNPLTHSFTYSTQVYGVPTIFQALCMKETHVRPDLSGLEVGDKVGMRLCPQES